jgi:energy-coupling factor transporter ATP-binding protein EcfA2
MARIKIKEFGPIKEGLLEGDGYIDIRKVTVFIGDQGSGKSSLAKLISTFSWMEKALVRGDLPKKSAVRKGNFNTRLRYHRLLAYQRPQTEIEYDGDAYRLRYAKGQLEVTRKPTGTYHLPQVIYAPAERNFIAYVSKPKALKNTSPALLEFVDVYDEAKDAMNGDVELPINQTTAKYNRARGVVQLSAAGYTDLDLTDASSGFQSLVPLYLVSQYLARSITDKGMETEAMSAEQRARFSKGVDIIWSDDSLTDEQRRVALKALTAKWNKSAFINIVEEPEQNLFPTSQWAMLQSLLKYNEAHNKLVITTHSPYLLAHFSLCIQARSLWEHDAVKSDPKAKERIAAIVPEHAMLDAGDAAFYQLGTDGLITKVERYEGILSDENALNHWLHETNERFDKLLEIEQAIENKGA